ncbi:PilZ domain-containing protein [Shewanella sp. NIFS-20-20]|uniref:PilZ domain-containing protein n=1 Tax=Shewanella sp. NIFS-20-20 TaxID=2853806 RepID=UPI001C4879C3|nr:PilZ domain-containing protein [Shewanella sp. NIFS-20-20]MBV7314599.1 PilZ domain-containing protein [Shewanella sp. NIFS-20-20]
MVDLSVDFESREQAYKAYMPFIRPMGLFFETSQTHALGDHVDISYRLPGMQQAFECAGIVVWINPVGASGARPTGIGVKLLTDPHAHKQHFDSLLSAELASSQLTSTM